MRKLVIFDMDGTIYLGKDLIPGAKEAFGQLNNDNVEYVFFTNNSSHDLDFYFEKIKNFGIKCDRNKNFYSSTEVAISYLKKQGLKNLFVIGNKSLKDKLSKDFVLVPKYEENTKIDGVLAGFSTELVYQELRDACLFLETRDIPFIATNGDYRCPIENGLYIPDCGGMIEWIRLATNKKARVMGKPDPEVIYTLARMFNVDLKDVVVVGDRIYTDILVGVNAGIISVMVLSGETKMEDLEKYSYRPTYIINSIKELPELLKKL